MASYKKNKYMKTIALILIAFSAVTASKEINAQSKYDVFPLRKNLTYAYSYYQESVTREFNSIVFHRRDSGNVEYIVRDSLRLNDTTVIWNIEQREALSQTKFTGGRDTTYPVVDTIVFPLYESLTGNHEIKCSSVVWNFPFYYSPSFSSIFRFSDTVSPLYIYSYNDFSNVITDSMWFSTSAGMYQRLKQTHSSHIQVANSVLIVKQSSVPMKEQSSHQNVVQQFSLFQNYPNPFNPSTSIKYSLDRSDFILLELFDFLGRKVMVIDRGIRPPGEHIVKLNTASISSGVYFYRLTNFKSSIIKKLVVLK